MSGASKNYENNTSFDDLYIQVASRVSCIDELLHTFCGFLHRKTDFYVEVPAGYKCKMGFHAGEAENMLRRAFQKYEMKRPPSSELVKSTSGGTPSTTPSKKAAPSPGAGAGQSTPAKSPLPTSTAPAAAASATSPQRSMTTPTKAQPTTPAAITGASMTPIKPRYTEEGKQIPIGNGGIADRYYWTQTLTDVTIYIDVPQGTKSKEVKCSILPGKISVELVGAAAVAAQKAEAEENAAGAGAGDGKATSSGGPAGGGNYQLIKGDFEGPVKLDDCMWTLQSASSSTGVTPIKTSPAGAASIAPPVQPPPTSVIIITLDKTIHTWWKSAVVGGPEIDTAKVDSTQKVADYDESTQAAIRKIMFEQKQQRLGLPLPADSILKPQVDMSKLPPLPDSFRESGGDEDDAGDGNATQS